MRKSISKEAKNQPTPRESEHLLERLLHSEWISRPGWILEPASYLVPDLDVSGRPVRSGFIAELVRLLHVRLQARRGPRRHRPQVDGGCR